MTLGLWLVSGAALGRYLASYAFAYVSMYAGLASAMIALIFLYVCASIFIYGGELNSVIAKERTTARKKKRGKKRARVSRPPPPARPRASSGPGAAR